jgi:MFS family permease
MSYEQLLAFSGTGLVLASVIHIAASTLVGLLYSVLLPIFPRRPILVGGIIAPLLWSGLLYAAQDIINPALNARIDWPWFMMCQFVYGVLAGLVVARHARVFTLQYLPIAVRLGVEAPGFMKEKNGEEPKP